MRFQPLKVDYIIELLKQHSILFIVEHWLSDDKLYNPMYLLIFLDIVCMGFQLLTPQCYY